MCFGIAQCSYATLRKIQDVYGGTMRKRDPRVEKNRKGNPSNHRHQYILSFRGIQVAGILPFIAKYLVLKGQKANLIVDLLQIFNKCGQRAKEKRNEIIQEFRRIEGIQPQSERINWQYICGLFQAEGCLREDKLSIAQKQCPKVLYEIKSFMEKDLQMSLGQVDTEEERFVTHKKHEIRAILRKFEDVGLFHDEKLHQIEAFHRNDVVELKRLKHVDEDAPQDLIDDGNNKALQHANALRMAWRASKVSN